MCLPIWIQFIYLHLHPSRQWPKQQTSPVLISTVNLKEACKWQEEPTETMGCISYGSLHACRSSERMYHPGEPRGWMSELMSKPVLWWLHRCVRHYTQFLFRCQSWKKTHFDSAVFTASVPGLELAQIHVSTLCVGLTNKTVPPIFSWN